MRGGGGSVVVAYDERQLEKGARRRGSLETRVKKKKQRAADQSRGKPSDGFFSPCG